MVYRRYMTLYDRVVTFDQDAKGTGHGAEDAAANGQPPKRSQHTLVYDVVGHPQCEFIFSIAFPFHKATATTPPQVTVIREYAQGPNCLQYCLPTGGFDPRKHGNLLDCARAEMREEAMLMGGEVVPLLPDDHPGQSEVKWSRNSFKPFLFIDPQPDPSGHAARDAEEHTIEVSRISISELRSLMLGGQMMLPSIFTCYLALEALDARRLI
ncbi:hypothetical protein HYH03_002430 [Edaphochlamys debaryana]|uniref:Nudix hydrolase domain-containing protein n=1 Tax=Edaphochlamys debaryana TaxID=47281 RepID=A0A836C508_9CHLO|nr:hypothetical protein HYH03_002430 [Edaphochlamys debaryana]|eukprot:KAG2499483.1 hypothetical protein HYH03_002430 [Edaphochlamys debaryana]